MSVVINGMEAPECCEYCEFTGYSNQEKAFICNIAHKAITKSYCELIAGRPVFCPITELTEEQEKYLGIATESNNDERGI